MTNGRQIEGSGEGPVTESRGQFGAFRIAVLGIGALDCFVSGTSYLYGVFQPYVMEYFGVDSASASTPFTLMWMFMTLAQFLSEPMQKRIGAKGTAAIGLALMALGCLSCSAVSPDMAIAMTLCYTVLFGVGLGICFNVVAATVVRWFPDHKGVAASISVGMIGGSGILLPPVFGMILNEYGLQMGFRCHALLFVPCILLTLAVFRDAPPGYMADYVPKGIVAEQTSARECTCLRDLVTSRDAWMTVVLFLSLVTVYVIISAAFVSYGSNAKQLDPAMAVWFVSAASLANVVGRFAIPSVSDRVGRKAIFLFVFGLMALAVILITVAEGIAFALAFCMLSFAYGGGVTAMPVLIADRLGSSNAGQNLAFAEIGTLLASLASFALVNMLPTGLAIAVSGAGGCILGVAAIVSIFGSEGRKMETS